MFTDIYDFQLLICIVVFVLWEIFSLKKTILFIYPLSTNFAKPVGKFRHILLAKG